MEKYNYSQDKAESVAYEVKSIPSDEEGNRWIAPWPGYAGTISCPRTAPDEQLFQCSNGFLFNYTAKDAYALSQNGIVRPKVIAYTTRTGEEIKQMNSSMFYMNGHGLKYFEPFFTERGLIGTEVKVYKANWNGGNPHIEQSYVEILDQIENMTVSE